MPRHLLRWTLLLAIVLLIGAAIWHFTRPQPVEILVKPVTRGKVERTVANTRAGTVKSCRRAKLSPSVGGQIAVLPIKEGDQVREGQLLLELWNRDLKAQALLVEHELASARSRTRAVCLKAGAAQRNAQRLVNLGRDNVASEERVDQAVSDAAALKAECEAAHAEIDIRQAQVAAAQANLDRTRLTAPFDGVIAEINGELFEFVTPSPIGIATPPAVDIIDNTCFYVAAPIDEVDAAEIRVGMPARITMDAFKDRRFEGTVRRIADYVLDIEKQARTVEVEVVFSDPKDFQQLLPGYSADIEVILTVRDDVVRVPTAAVLPGPRVYVFEASAGVIQRREVRTGLSNWEWTEVLEGLAAGDRVVVNIDNPKLADNAPASLLEEER